MRSIPNLADANPFPHADVVQIVISLDPVMFAEHRVVSIMVMSCQSWSCRVSHGQVVSIVCPVCHKTIGSTNSIAVHVNKEQSKVLVGEAKEYTENFS